MIPAGLVNALYAWANSSDATTKAANIAKIQASLDAAVGGLLEDGEASTTLTNVSANGKTVAMLQNLSREDKISLFSSVLTLLGVFTAAQTATVANFRCLQR